MPTLPPAGARTGPELGPLLRKVIDGARVLDRYLDRVAYANDASVYRRVPQVVVRPRSIEEVRALLRFGHTHRVPLTFRAAGTSLSGQAITDAVLVDLSRDWRRIEVLDGGRGVRVQPAAIGGVVNARLQPLGFKIGPDPASINACMMGGILANNSSGMCCGVVHNAYHTLRSMVFVLPDGTVVDSSVEGAGERLAHEAPALVRGLMDLRERVMGDARLVERIRSKYRLKNTNGYSLNAFLDFDRPVDILAHLMIGSEGTLGFIAEAVLETVVDHPLKYTGLLFFPDVPRACEAIAPLRDSGARALELMDRASLRAIEEQPGVPSGIRDLPPRAAALLVEYACASEADVERSRRACERVLPSLALHLAPQFTRDPGRQAALWRVRKGLVPSVGAVRPRGTSFIIEDVVFPVESLAQGVTELQALFAAHGYDDAIVFGHAKDGNLHFVLTQGFQDPREVERYDAFMRALAELVAGRHGGALKAEHGTGRNMAPFVETEWGSEAYAIMKALKRIVDPAGILNPGVILNDDPRAHLADLKSLPEVKPEVDACTECGFCERMCPSRDLTLTPRQRIVVRREMSRLGRLDPASPVLRSLEADYAYAGLDTCAADGLCATSCPVGIDTGALVKHLRREAHSAVAQEIALAVVDRLALVERGARAMLRIGHAARRWLGPAAADAVARVAGRAVGLRPAPWDAAMPPAAPGGSPPTSRARAHAVYFPSCVARVLGGAPRVANLTLREVVLAVGARAGEPLWIPEDAAGHCCGMPFSSKGYDRAYVRAVNALVHAMGDWTAQGRLPVVLDTSPCAYTLGHARPDLTESNRRIFDRLEILDGIEFAHDRLLPRLAPEAGSRRVVLHPVCSVIKMELVEKLRAVAAAAAAQVEIPLAAGCCGFAGDRGFTHPELTAAATAAEAAEVRTGAFDGAYSSSPTCEIGLTRATGRSYRSFWYLLEEATRPGVARSG